jgi:ABC-type phosphate transport system substrate-binding protein
MTSASRGPVQAYRGAVGYGRRWGRRKNGAQGMLLLLLTLLHAVPTALALDDVAVIGHRDLSSEPLSTHSIRAVFAMRQRSWPDGQAVRVFVLPDDDLLHIRFTKAVLGVFPHQLRLAWDRQVFSGSGQAPQRVADEIEMLRRVAATPGAIGYITRGALNEQVRAILVD